MRVNILKDIFWCIIVDSCVAEEKGDQEEEGPGVYPGKEKSFKS